MARRRPYALLYDEVGRSSDQDQVLDLVAADQNEAAAAINGCRVHDGKSWPARSAAGNEGAAAQPSQEAQDHPQEDQCRQAGEQP